MNILHITNGFVGSKLYRNFFLELSALKQNQTVIAPIRTNKQNGINNITNGIEVIYLKIVTSNIYRVIFFLKIKKTVKLINQNIKISNFDFIHAHTLFSDGAVAYQYNKPYIVTIRNTDINTFFKYLFFLRKYGIKILVKANYIVFLSPSYKKRLFDNYIPSKYKTQLLEKSFIIPNGIDSFWLNNIHNQKKILSKKIHLLFTGEIRKNKNIHGIIDAIDKLRQHNIELTIVGEGLNDEITYLKELKDRIKHTENINLKLAVPKEELIKYYRKAHIFITPSFTESFGLVYAEALSQGLPIIYSKDEGFDHIFPDAFVGQAVNPRSSENIANAIDRIIQNYPNYQKNCVKAANKFSWKRISEVYLQKYLTMHN